LLRWGIFVAGCRQDIMCQMMWMFQPRTQKKVISVIARWKGEKSISYWLFPAITLEASESNFLSFLSGRYLMADSARLHKEQQLGASQLLAGNKDRVRRGASVALSARLHSRAGLQRDCSAPQILASKCQDVAGSLCLTTCLDRVTFTGSGVIWCTKWGARAEPSTNR